MRFDLGALRTVIGSMTGQTYLKSKTPARYRHTDCPAQMHERNRGPHSGDAAKQHIP